MSFYATVMTAIQFQYHYYNPVQYYSTNKLTLKSYHENTPHIKQAELLLKFRDVTMQLRAMSPVIWWCPKFFGQFQHA